MTPEQAREFVANNHRAVLITRRSAGGLQTSPVIVGIDSNGKVVISSRETAYKVRNLRRHPTATLCVFTDDFFGPWIQIEGVTEIVPLPAAMEGLIDYYRRISGGVTIRPPAVARRSLTGLLGHGPSPGEPPTHRDDDPGPVGRESRSKPDVDGSALACGDPDAASRRGRARAAGRCSL